jgi:hypothetical protein
LKWWVTSVLTRWCRFTDGSRASGAKTTASVGIVYQDPFLGTVTVDEDVLDGPNFDIAFLKKYNGFLLGANVKVNTTLLSGDKKAGPVSLGPLGAIVGYQTADFTLYTQSNKACETLDIGLTHTASSSLTAGFLATIGIKESKAPVSVCVCSLGLLMGHV